jgi:hypothetical protein
MDIIKNIKFISVIQKMSEQKKRSHSMFLDFIVLMKIASPSLPRSQTELAMFRSGHGA